MSYQSIYTGKEIDDGISINTTQNNRITNTENINSLQDNRLDNIENALNTINLTLQDLNNRIITIEKQLDKNEKIKTFLNGMATKQLPDGSNWCRIVYQNVGQGAYFNNSEEALNANSMYKKSQLYRLSDFRDNSGKFEFMLCYPSYTSGYNRWKQTPDPTSQIESTLGQAAVNGYEEIQKNIPNSSNFKGILRSATSESCYIDGYTNHSNWWFAICSYSSYSGGIPGPENIVINSEVELWVRYDDAVNRL